jgi:hypothetical protein
MKADSAWNITYTIARTVTTIGNYSEPLPRQPAVSVYPLRKRMLRGSS